VCTIPLAIIDSSKQLPSYMYIISYKMAAVCMDNVEWTMCKLCAFVM